MPQRTKSPPLGQHWRTLARQPRAAFKDGVFTLSIDVAKQRGDNQSKAWKRVSAADGWKLGGWATEAAALAARHQFKHWVDYEMNSQQRGAQTDAARARSPASLAAALSPPAATAALAAACFNWFKTMVTELLCLWKFSNSGKQITAG